MTSLLGRLFKRQASPRRIPAATLLAGRDTLEVVGESFYQDALWQLVGGFHTERVSQACQATLLPEPTNTYDKNAIEVLIDGHLVGLFRAKTPLSICPVSSG